MTSRRPAWPIVASREIVARLTDRNFLISTGFTILIIVGMTAFQAFLAARTTTTQIATSGAASGQIVAAAGREAASSPVGAHELVARPVASPEAGRAALTDGSADAWLHEEGGGFVLTGKEDVDPQLGAAITDAVRDAALARNAAAAGTSLPALEKGSTLKVDALQGSGGDDEKMVRTIAGFVFAFLFYFASLMFGMGIANSVVEEKQSRIVEILATAIPVRQLLAGKVVGATVLALGQMILFVGVGLVGMSFTPMRAYLAALAGPSAWFLLFFVVGFIALACIWAVCGSLASRSEDLQASTLPMSLLLMGAFFLGLMGHGVWRVVGSYVPIAASISMPGRLLDGSAAWWEPILSLAITIAFAGLMIFLGERLYRRSLLQTHGRVTLRQAMRLEE